MALGWLWWRAWVLWSPRLFAWQAWRLATSTFTLRGRCGTWCGRRGTYGTGLALVAFVTHNSFTHTTLSHISCTHNFVTHFFHTQLCHTFLSHTTLSHTHNSFTHNFVTHTTLSHTQLCHTQLFHTQFCHIHFVHTQHFYIHQFTRTHTTLPHTALLPNPACTISLIFPVFPISFSHLLGDYWKKLTCEDNRSFNFLIYIKYSPPVIFGKTSLNTEFQFALYFFNARQNPPRNLMLYFLGGQVVSHQCPAIVLSVTVEIIF